MYKTGMMRKELCIFSVVGCDLGWLRYHYKVNSEFWKGSASMALTDADVRQVALLARLGLSDEELAGLRGELNGILEYVEQLQELDLDDVEPTTHAVPLVNSMRADELMPTLTQEQVLMNAPESRDGAFLIPRIVAPGQEGTEARAEGANEGGAA